MLTSKRHILMTQYFTLVSLGEVHLNVQQLFNMDWRIYFSPIHVRCTFFWWHRGKELLIKNWPPHQKTSLTCPNQPKQSPVTMTTVPLSFDADDRGSRNISAEVTQRWFSHNTPSKNSHPDVNFNFWKILQ